MRIAKKCLHILLVAVVLVTAFAFGASAEGKKSDELAREQTDELLHDFSLILPEGMEGLTDGAAVSEALGFESLLSEAVAAVRGELPSALSFFLFLVGVSVLLAAVGYTCESMGSAVRPAIAIVAGCALFARLLPLLVDTSACFADLGEFFSLLIPVLTGAAALSGGTAIASTAGLGMSLTLSLFGAVCSLLLPLVALMSVLGIVSVLAPEALRGSLDGVRRAVMRGIGIVSAALGGLFALQTAVAAARDGATLRAVKYAATGSIPVVGGTVSGALSTLAGGLEYAVGVIGGGGAAAMLALVLSPLVRLLLYKLAFFFAQLLLDALPSGEGAGVLRAASHGLDALTAVYSLGAVIYLLEAVTVMKGIVSVL